VPNPPSRTAVLLGGPTGVGKSTVLSHLLDSIPRSATLDADDVWKVEAELAVPENRAIAIANTVAVMRGYFEAGCETGILSWVFAREALYGPVIEALEENVDSIQQIYLVADEKCLEDRLRKRGSLDLLEYSLSRLRLIEELPFPRIDTSNLTPIEVAEEIKERVYAGV
jgi:hypothetical protein